VLAGLLDLLIEYGSNFGNQIQNMLFFVWSQINEWSLFGEVAQGNSMIFHCAPLSSEKVKAQPWRVMGLLD
jgi:hypothetical protein